MSFVITVYVAEAIVMASDSRQFLNIQGNLPNGQSVNVETVSSDFAFKTFLLEGQSVGVNAFGTDFLDNVSLESHVRRISEEHLTENDDVQTVAEKLTKAMRERYSTAETGFHVAGFKTEGQTSVPYVFEAHVARNEVRQRNTEPQNAYGAIWSGQPDVMTRLLNTLQVRGPDGKAQPFQAQPVFWPAFNVQDAIDFAIYAVRTTIDTMRFEARQKNVGGPIDVLVLTPGGTFWAQRKKFHGERVSGNYPSVALV